MLASRHRIVRGDDYRAVVRLGKRLGGKHCLAHTRETAATSPARFGFIVNKAVGKAHTRNLIRRRLKAIASELIKDGLVGLDVVIRAHPQSVTVPFGVLREDIRELFPRFAASAAPASEVA